MTSLAPKPAASTPRTLNARLAAFGTLLLADVAYAMLIVAGISFGDDNTVLPAQVSQIVVGALVTATVLTGILAICGRCTDRATVERQAREDFEQETRAWMGAVMETLADLKAQGARGGETTADLGNRAAGRVVYASIASTNGGQVAAFGDALSRQVDHMLDRFKAGVAATLQEADRRIDGRLSDMEEVLGNGEALGGGRVNGSVTHLQRSRA